MAQAKFKVLQVIDFGSECLCQADIGGRKIAVQAIVNDFHVKPGDEVLLEYNPFSRMTKGTVIAVCQDWVNQSPESVMIKGIDMPEEKEMQQHLVELLLKNFYTVGIRFKNSHKVYTYKVDLATELAEEDQVVVQTTSGYEIVTVARVDEGMNIDVTSDIKYKFIVQKLDLTQYEELCDKDKNVAGVIATSAAEKQRQEIVETFTGTLDDSQIKLLSDCGVTAIEKL